MQQFGIPQQQVGTLQQLSRSLRQIEPLVRHGIQELRQGAPIDHTLREVALMGTMVGAGLNANQAIRTVERFESQLLSYGGYERAEQAYHTAPWGQQVGGYGQQIGGYGQQIGGYGQQVGGGFGKMGQQIPMTYVPSGNVWMGQ